MKTAVWIKLEDEAFALSFRPHRGAFDRSRVPAPGNLPFKTKKANARRLARVGGGRAQLDLTDVLNGELARRLLRFLLL